MKKNVYLIFGLILISCIQVTGQKKELLDSIIQIASQKLDKQDYEGAEKEFDKVLKTKEDHIEGVSGKIKALILAEKIKEAADYIEVQIKENPDASVFYYGRGLLWNYKKQYKKALEDFNIAIDNDLKNELKVIYLSRGISLEGLKEYEDALFDFDTYLITDENNITALYHSGLCNYQMENYNRAIEFFNKVVETDKKNGSAFYNMGMAYYRTNDLLNACKNFQLACQLNNINACKMILTVCAK